MVDVSEDQISLALGAVLGATGAGVAASNSESAVFITVFTGFTVLIGHVLEQFVRKMI